jgi:indoleamine 2,3-dioxygenase
MDVASSLSQLVADGRCREACLALPIPNFSGSDVILDERAAERLHQAYAFLSNGYLWQPGAEPTRQLPRTLAIPFVQLSARVKRPPTLSYTNTQLTNWRRLDPAGEISVENIKAVQMFQSLPDEEWFWVLHIVIEARGAPAVIAGTRLVQAAKINDIDQIEMQLEIIRCGLETIIELAGRMEEGCRPEVYYETLRPFLFAHPDGVVFDGVQAFGGKPQTFLGQTGAQSALIPAICTSLGLRHARSELTTYLEAVRAYMPEPHRQFVAGLEGQVVRDCVSSTVSQNPVRTLYNSCVEKVVEFRRLHLGLAANYIASRMDNPRGTGGTDFMRWLKHMTRETTEQML